MQDKLLELLDEIEIIADDVQWYDQVIANRLVKIALEIKTLKGENHAS
jgi:hypothetical protein